MMMKLRSESGWSRAGTICMNSIPNLLNLTTHLISFKLFRCKQLKLRSGLIVLWSGVLKKLIITTDK